MAVVPWPSARLNTVDNGGRPPDPPNMELKLRVTRLEEDMKEIKATVTRTELMVTRIDATMQHVATKANVDALTEKVGSLDKRVGLIETTVGSKLIGGWGMIGVITGVILVITGAITLLFTLNNVASGRTVWQFTTPQSQPMTQPQR